jgi:hypothetical protein
MAAKRKVAARKAAPRKPAATRKVSRRPTVGARRKAVVSRPPVRKALAGARTGATTAKAVRLAGVGSEAVLKATGRAWDEWLRLLDRAGAKSLKHKDIALMLSRKFAVPDWWSQMITVGYEQARGLRAVYQKADGFSAHASKTVGTQLTRLYAAWSDPLQRARWLPNAPIEVSRSTDGKSMRMRWTQGGSHVDVGFYAKGADKSMVALEHGKLASARAVATQKAFWSDALARLKTLLEDR